MYIVMHGETKLGFFRTKENAEIVRERYARMYEDDTYVVAFVAVETAA